MRLPKVLLSILALWICAESAVGQSDPRSAICAIQSAIRGESETSFWMHHQEEFEDLRFAILYDDSLTLTERPAFQQWIILLARTQLQWSDLKQMTGDSLFTSIDGVRSLPAACKRWKVEEIEHVEGKQMLTGKQWQGELTATRNNSDLTIDVNSFWKCASTFKSRKQDLSALVENGSYMKFGTRDVSNPWSHFLPRLNPEITYELLRQKFDVEYPGRGRDTFNDSLKDRPMAYALILKAEARRFRATNDTTALLLVRRCADWLLENVDLDGDSIPGYGLADAWDAFNDGSVNSAHHEYAMTTASVCDALLDWIETDRDVDYWSVYKHVYDCLVPFLDPENQSKGFIPPYSLADSDIRFDVYHTAAMLAVQCQRLALKLVSKVQGQKLNSEARKIRDILLDRTIEYDGKLYWNYSHTNFSANELAQAIIMWRSMQHLRVKEQDQMGLHIYDFYSHGQWYNHCVQHKQTEEKLAKLSGLSLLCDFLHREGKTRVLEGQMMEQLYWYQLQPGSFMVRPGDSRSLVKEEAMLLYGLSTILY